MCRNIAWKLLLIGAAALSSQGCVSTPERLSAVPSAITAQAQIPGMPGVRYVAGGDLTEMFNLSVEGQRREQAYRASQGITGELPPAVFLAVSGGGDNGAFSAGLLNGWTAAGTRPEFKLVTGISTGALIAPFAFLGNKYDATLKEVYTTISAKDVIKTRSFIAGVFGDAMADNAPLWKLTRKSVNADLLKQIADEYAKGRFLLIGTADLDARRPIIWDMGKIASYGGQQALDLFVSIMIASASIPAGFPPVMIDVEADGKHYQEMHVDGGTMAQVFVYPAAVGREDGIGHGRHAGSQALRDTQRAAGPGLGASRSQDDEHRRTRGQLADPHARYRRPLSHLRHRAARRRRLQPGVHPLELQCASQRGIRQCLHARAL